MKKWMIVLVAAAVLSSCGRYDFKPVASFGIQASDGVKSGEVIRKVDDKGKITYTQTPGEPVQFTFSSRPGSQSGYLTGYKIVRDNINGVDQNADASNISMKTNIFIPAGYICPKDNNGGTIGQPDGVAGTTQPCSINDPKAIPGNARADTTSILELGNASLVDKAIAENRSQSRTLDIIFVGYSATYEPIEVKATNVITGVVFLNQ